MGEKSDENLVRWGDMTAEEGWETRWGKGQLIRCTYKKERK